MRLVCHEPFWKSIHTTAATMTTTTDLTVYYFAGRESGLWSNMGVTSDPAMAKVRTVAIAPNGDVYIGGDFVNWSTIAAADRIAYWDGSNWNALGSGIGNGAVQKLLFGPDGDLYVAGSFVDAGGVLNADYIARWDGSSWNALGTGGGATSSNVADMVFDSTGNLYVGGLFANMGGVAAADNFAKWDGSSWSAPLADPPSTSVLALAIDSQDNVYLGGAFTQTMGAVPVSNYIVKFDGSALVDMANGMGDQVRSLATDAAGNVYLGGVFTADGDGVSMNRLAKWNGQAFSALGSGVNGAVNDIAIDPLGRLWVSGIFTEAGGSSLIDNIAIWDGSQFSQIDIDLPGTAEAYGIAFHERPQNKFDVYLGFDTTGTATVSGVGTTTITNNGSAPAYPIIKIKRTGGTSATLETIRNEDSGLQLLFDLSILDGETVIINLESKTVTSDYRGNLIGKLLSNSDLANWSLLPGANDIYLYVSEAGSPTITATMQWRERFWSADDS